MQLNNKTSCTVWMYTTRRIFKLNQCMISHKCYSNPHVLMMRSKVSKDSSRGFHMSSKISFLISVRKILPTSGQTVDVQTKNFCLGTKRPHGDGCESLGEQRSGATRSDDELALLGYSLPKTGAYCIAGIESYQKLNKRLLRRFGMGVYLGYPTCQVAINSQLRSYRNRNCTEQYFFKKLYRVVPRASCLLLLAVQGKCTARVGLNFCVWCQCSHLRQT